METEDFIISYWRSVALQDAGGLRACFCPGARIRWHCTNEQFTVEEFIRANCEYPGDWQGQVERTELHGPLAITATRVWSDQMSFHVCSFFKLQDGKILSLDEYWGDDGEPPAWRRAMGLGVPIR